MDTTEESRARRREVEKTSITDKLTKKMTKKQIRLVMSLTMMAWIMLKRKTTNLTKMKEGRDLRRRGQLKMLLNRKRIERKRKSEESFRKLKPSVELMKKGFGLNRTREIGSFVMRRRGLPEILPPNSRELRMKQKRPALLNSRKRGGSS